MSAANGITAGTAKGGTSGGAAPTSSGGYLVDDNNNNNNNRGSGGGGDGYLDEEEEDEYMEGRGVVSKFGANSLQSRLAAMRLEEEKKRKEQERAQGYIAKVGSAIGWGASWLGV